MDGFLNDVWYPLHDAWRHYFVLRVGVEVAILAGVLWYRRPLWRFLLRGSGAQ